MASRWLLPVIAAALVLAPPTRARAEAVNCSRAEASGERTLCHEAIVAAPLIEVWALWTTVEGLRSWAAPIVAIDPRPGGVFESSYNANARIGDPTNIRNRVLAVVPERMLVIQIAQAPPGFPSLEQARQLVTVIELEPAGDRATRVRVSMLGYRSEAAFGPLYRHFEWGNAWSLNKLSERVTRGPIDWRAVAQTQER